METTSSRELGIDRLRGPLSRVLRPLVRLFIKTGVTFPALQDMLRELYVNVAQTEFGLMGKEQTDSRVSLLTGIHRKEVSRLRSAGAPVNAMPSSLSSSSRILARWLGAAEFSDANGPLPLPRLRVESAPSFDTLVESVTRDVRPRAVLDEWLDRGLVRLDEEDRVELLETALVPAPGEAQQLYYFGRNLHDHIAAATANISENTTPRFFERAMHYDRLPLSVLQDLERRSRELATDALQKANREAISATAAAEDGAWRLNFGIYVYAERAPEQPDTGAAS